MPCKLGPRRRRVHPERQSHLDGDPVWSDITNAYRGFFTLFILCTIVDVLLPVVEHWERANVLLPVFNDREDGERRITSMWHAIAMRFLDWAVFVVSDMVMIAFTFSAVVVQRAVHDGTLSIAMGTLLKHMLQALLVIVSALWSIHCNWSWLQSASFVAHSVSMCMKMHSYTSVNTELELLYRRARDFRVQLEMQAKQHAEMHAMESADAEDVQNSTLNEDASMTPPSAPPSTPPSTLMTPSSAPPSTLMTPSSAPPSTLMTPSSTPPSTLMTPSSTPPSTLMTPQPLRHRTPRQSHASITSSDRVGVEAELHLLDTELRTGTPYAYPGNLTFVRFFDFLLVPTYVYELEYARTESIRWWYIAQKLMAFVASVCAAYMIIEYRIVPILADADGRTVAKTVLHLMTPTMTVFLLLFFIVFECICNLFAEVTRFSHRDFYGPWWNSLTFEDFARTWNRPVHEFLHRHVYDEARQELHMSKRDAMLLTFVLSALVHELVVAVLRREVRFVFFGFQLLQLVFMWVASLVNIPRHPLIANALFWVLMATGMPLLVILHTREDLIWTPFRGLMD